MSLEKKVLFLNQKIASRKAVNRDSINIKVLGLSLIHIFFMPDILWLAHRYGIDPQLDSLRKTLGFMALVSDKVCGD